MHGYLDCWPLWQRWWWPCLWCGVCVGATLCGCYPGITHALTPPFSSHYCLASNGDIHNCTVYSYVYHLAWLLLYFTFEFRYFQSSPQTLVRDFLALRHHIVAKRQCRKAHYAFAHDHAVTIGNVALLLEIGFQTRYSLCGRSPPGFGQVTCALCM